MLREKKKRWIFPATKQESFLSQMKRDDLINKEKVWEYIIQKLSYGILNDGNTNEYSWIITTRFNINVVVILNKVQICH